MRTSLIVAVASVAFLAWALRPVCVPLSEEELSGFNVPIEQRTDRDFYFKVFQQKESQWYQCKTWLSRQFFF
jgi:hypothetical protein